METFQRRLKIYIAFLMVTFLLSLSCYAADEGEFDVPGTQKASEILPAASSITESGTEYLYWPRPDIQSCVGVVYQFGTHEPKS